MTIKEEIMTMTERDTTTNLFRYQWILNICRSRYFPLVLQTLTIVLLAIMLYDGFYGKQSSHENLAILGPWFLLWPLTLLLTLLVFGRVWCAICPMGAISAACERVGQRRKFPKYLQTTALVISLVTFVGVLRIFRPALGVTAIPFNSALFFALFLTLAVALGLIFKGRSFCRYLCPITLPLNLFSRLAPIELRADRTICRTCKTRECLKGSQSVEGCPMDINPPSMDGISNCIYCMKCVKSCPNGSMGLYTRPVGWELLKVNKVGVFESVAALSLVGVFPLMMAYMTIQGTLTDRPLAAVSQGLAAILSRPVDAGVIHVASTTLWVTVALVLFALSSLVSANVLNIKFKQAFSIFGPPFILLSVLPTLGHLIVNKIPNDLGVPITYLLSSVGVHFYHTPNIIEAGISSTLSTVNVFLMFPLACLLAALTVYWVAKKVDRKKALAGSLPFIFLLMLFLVLVGNQRLAGFALPHL